MGLASLSLSISLSRWTAKLNHTAAEAVHERTLLSGTIACTDLIVSLRYFFSKLFKQALMTCLVREYLRFFLSEGYVRIPNPVMLSPSQM